MTKAGKRLMKAAEEMLAIAKGEAEPADLYIPAEFDVKAIRRKTKLSQDKFVSAFGFTKEQIRAWEQGRTSPVGGVRAYLMMIDADHGAVERLLEATKKRVAA